MGRERIFTEETFLWLLWKYPFRSSFFVLFTTVHWVTLSCTIGNKLKGNFLWLHDWFFLDMSNLHFTSSHYLFIPDATICTASWTLYTKSLERIFSSFIFVCLFVVVFKLIVSADSFLAFLTRIGWNTLKRKRKWEH